MSYLLLDLTLAGQRECDTLALHWPDHISLQTLERMSLAIMNDTVSGQLALQYKLCVLSKAIIFVSRWLRLCSPGILADSLNKSRKEYTAACLECLTIIDFSRSPSLAMLQALLCGVCPLQPSQKILFLTSNRHH